MVPCTAHIDILPPHHRYYACTLHITIDVACCNMLTITLLLPHQARLGHLGRGSWTPT